MLALVLPRGKGGPVEHVIPAAMRRPRRQSPTSTNRHLGSLLVDARRAADHTQETAARGVGWSKRKLQMIETADLVISARDLDRLLSIYAVPDADWPAWHALATEARHKGWWDRYDAPDLSAQSKRHIGLEQGATRMRCFEPLIIHGLLQTPEYREVVVTSTSIAPRPAELVAAMVEITRHRQAVLDGDAPLELWAVLDEAALHRAVGDPEVMRTQLEHVADLADRRHNITVQVIPFGAGMHAGLHGSFWIMEFGWPYDHGLVFNETSPDRPNYLNDRGSVYDYSQLFDHLVGLALSPDDSVQMLRNLAG
jgi:hypothetical protein